MRALARPAGHTLANDRLSLSFDGKTGELRSVRNLATGNEYLQLLPVGGNPFALYHDFTGLFDVTSSGGTPSVATDPASITKSVFAPRQAAKASFRLREGRSAKRLTVTYTGALWQAELVLTLAAKSSVVECDLAVTNLDTIPAACLCVFPFLSGIRLGTGRRTRMVCPTEAGYVRDLWCDYEGGIWGNSGQTSMQWGCAFDPDSKDALGFIVRDAALENKDIRYRKPSIEVRYFPPRTLFPRERVRFPRAALLVYAGDWKPAAEAYRRWFARACPPVRQPEWVRTLDSHLGQWFRKLKPGEKATGETGLGSHLRSFEDLPDVYRRLPVSCIEFSFHGEGCSRPRRIGGKLNYRHTDGDNVLRSDLGGAPALKRGIALTHALGMRFSFCVEGYIVPFEARLLSRRGALGWTVMNRDGGSLGDHSREGFVHMCPGCAEWQDHLARAAARLVRQTGADGVRLDSLGSSFYPCYNPAHRHRSPWDYNLWIDELLGKVARAVRAVNPDCLLTTEGGVDFYARHFNGALTQQSHPREVVAVTGDVAPMRVALPDYFVIVHTPCGPLAAALMGYPGGSGGLQPAGRFTELDKLWRGVRFAVADTIRWGSVSRPAPTASRPDVQSRLFSDRRRDVLVVARPELRRNSASYPRHERGVHLNADIDVRADRVAYTVTVDTGGRSPSAAYLYDVESLRLGVAHVVLQNGTVTLATRSNWFMAVLCYGAAPLATSLEVSERMAPGSRAEARIWAFGPDGVIPLRGGPVATALLRVPALGLERGMEVPVPGEVSIPVPRKIRPGSYVCTLSGPGLLGCMRFLEVR